MSAGPTNGAVSTGAALRHVLGHLVTPLLMCIGMGLAYLGAFHSPQPHELRVAVVGSGPSAQVLAQTLHDKGDGALDVRTVPDRGSAVQQLKDQDVYGAFVPNRTSPELVVASASSDTTATAVEKVFTQVAAQQGEPLKVTDVAPTASGDPTGQGIFFLLVALSIGSYASVAVIGGAGGCFRCGSGRCWHSGLHWWSARSVPPSPGRCSIWSTTDSSGSGPWRGSTRQASCSSVWVCTPS